MAKSQKSAAKTKLASVRHRAVCNDDSYKGSWDEDINKAFADAARHRQKNPGHDVEIITEQTLSLKYVGDNDA
jgi:hypothetical protein